MLIRKAKDRARFSSPLLPLDFSARSIVAASNVFITCIHEDVARPFTRPTSRASRWLFYASFYELEAHTLNRDSRELQGLRSGSSLLTQTGRILTFTPEHSCNFVPARFDYFFSKRIHFLYGEFSIPTQLDELLESFRIISVPSYVSQ